MTPSTNLTTLIVTSPTLLAINSLIIRAITNLAIRVNMNPIQEVSNLATPVVNDQATLIINNQATLIINNPAMLVVNALAIPMVSNPATPVVNNQDIPNSSQSILVANNPFILDSKLFIPEASLALLDTNSPTALTVLDSNSILTLAVTCRAYPDISSLMVNNLPTLMANIILVVITLTINDPTLLVITTLVSPQQTGNLIIRIVNTTPVVSTLTRFAPTTLATRISRQTTENLTIPTVNITLVKVIHTTKVHIHIPHNTPRNRNTATRTVIPLLVTCRAPNPASMEPVLEEIGALATQGICPSTRIHLGVSPIAPAVRTVPACLPTSVCATKAFTKTSA